MCSKDADGMENKADSNQNAPLRGFDLNLADFVLLKRSMCYLSDEGR